MSQPAAAAKADLINYVMGNKATGRGHKPKHVHTASAKVGHRGGFTGIYLRRRRANRIRLRGSKVSNF